MLMTFVKKTAFGILTSTIAHLGNSRTIQYPVGAITHTAHGLGVALLLPYVMDYNRAASPSEYAQVASAMGVEQNGKSEDALSRAAVEAVAALFAKIGIPRTLADIKLPAEKLEWTAEQSFTAQRLIKNNPKPLDVVVLGQIIKAAFEGRLLSH
jgi:alcohol dehydrogenase class IV